MVMIQSDIRSAIHAAAVFRHHHHFHHRLFFPRAAAFHQSPPLWNFKLRIRAFSTTEDGAKKVNIKPQICTADELHYVSVNNSDWRLALWRYNPPPEAPKRNHPLLLHLSSFARYMSGQGFDTWILEVRGAGLSMHESDSKDIEKSAHAISDQGQACSGRWRSFAVPSAPSTIVNGDSVKTQTTTIHEYQGEIEPTIVDEVTSGISTTWDESQMVNKLSETFMRLFNETRERLLRLLESANSAVDIPRPRKRALKERMTRTIEDFQKQLDLIVKYDWDFDHYLEEDVPAAMQYIKALTKPKDGKLLAIGHSMGGILLYAMLSRYGYEEREPGLAAVVTLASSLDYTTSKSSLKLLIPLADPAQALNVPVVPLGAMLAAAYPISSPEIFAMWFLNNFCTIPAKLLLQLTSAFREGGLRDRSGKFFYKDHLHKSKTPVLALAGDRDLICPPEAVYDVERGIKKLSRTFQWLLLNANQLTSYPKLARSSRYIFT
ncbi:hypothetical protein Leryth_025337 [Lithospermum erythrorhizon]|nr:hypothetical protein Leryth_025337 [Lithospermum erythrorhizon]